MIVRILSSAQPLSFRPDNRDDHHWPQSRHTSASCVNFGYDSHRYPRCCLVCGGSPSAAQPRRLS